MVNSSFTNLDRHIIVNLVYFLTGIAFILLEFLFLFSCVPYGNVCSWWGRILDIVMIPVGATIAMIAMYVGVISLCHLFKALSKVVIFIVNVITRIIKWADQVKIA